MRKLIYSTSTRRFAIKGDGAQLTGKLNDSPEADAILSDLQRLNGDDIGSDAFVVGLDGASDDVREIVRRMQADGVSQITSEKLGTCYAIATTDT